MNIYFKLFQSYFYYCILHNLGNVVMKIPGVCPKDDLCDNCYCTPCVCIITKDLLDVETMFTTIEPSKGVKQCLESDKRTEGVKCCLQPDSECLPSMIAKPSHHSVQNDCIEEQRDTRQNSRRGYGDKFYHTPQVRISNSSKRSIKFDENCVPSKRMQRASGNCVTKDLCGNCFSLPCECTIINVPSHIGKHLSLMFGTSNKQQNDKSYVKLDENSASCQHKKYSHVDIQKLSADLQFPYSENTTLKCHSTLPSDDHVKRLNTVKRSLRYDNTMENQKP